MKTELRWISTLAILLALAAPTGASAASAAPAPTVDCNAATRTLQARLDRLHVAVGPVDGCAGPALRAGVLAFQRANGLAADGVAGPATQAALSHPVTLRPSSRAAGTHVEVDLARQLTEVVRDGHITAIYAVSTGRAGDATPTGTYRVGRKERRSWSVPYRVWMPYASYFNGGVAFHEGGVETPWSSHGCVHVAPPFAAGLYSLLTVGTTVIVR